MLLPSSGTQSCLRWRLSGVGEKWEFSPQAPWPLGRDCYHRGNTSCVALDLSVSIVWTDCGSDFQRDPRGLSSQIPLCLGKTLRNGLGLANKSHRCLYTLLRERAPLLPHVAPHRKSYKYLPCAFSSGCPQFTLWSANQDGSHAFCNGALAPLFGVCSSRYLTRAKGKRTGCMCKRS